VYNSSNNNRHESEYNCWGKSQSQSNKACKKEAEAEYATHFGGFAGVAKGVEWVGQRAFD